MWRRNEDNTSKPVAKPPMTYKDIQPVELTEVKILYIIHSFIYTHAELLFRWVDDLLCHGLTVPLWWCQYQKLVLPTNLLTVLPKQQFVRGAVSSTSDNHHTSNSPNSPWTLRTKLSPQSQTLAYRLQSGSWPAVCAGGSHQEPQTTENKSEQE